LAIRPQSERRFARSSPVARYWLAQCEGFQVQGPVKGTVEQVVGSVDPRGAEELVVRRAWRRRHVPVAAVDTVVPGARLIVVDDSRIAAPAPARRPRARATLEVWRRVRLLVNVAGAVVLFVAAALVRVARARLRTAQLGAAATARFLADARARRQATVEKRRRAAARRPHPSVSNDGRRLTRAAVLGVHRRGGQKP
jgi:hypothetical protein